MTLGKKNILSEKSIFFIISVLQLVPYFANSLAIPTDGPQHLHNSQVIMQLLGSNTVFHEFYTFNPVLVGYWAGHFLLTVFNFLLPASLAEIFLISTYLLGMAFSFRYLVVAINPTPSYLTILIIPFSYTFYFMMGYYSFSLAFIFVFLVLGYYYKNRIHLKFKNIFVLFLFITCIFLSHAFVFALFGITVALFVFLEFLFDFFQNGKITDQLRIHGKRAILLLLASTPALILFVIYISTVRELDPSVSTGAGLKLFYERLNLMIKMHSLIGYHLEESYANYFYWVVLLLSVNYLLHKTFIKIKMKNLTRIQVLQEFFSVKYIWAYLTLVFLVVYFSIPNRISAGNLVNRIAVCMFFFLIIWVATINLPKKFSGWLAAIVFIMFVHQTHYRVKALKELSAFGKDVKSLEKYIEPNSIVHPYRVSSNWVDMHFINYLGINRPIINLGNPQCGGQFPVVWNYKRLPILMVGDVNVTNQFNRDHEKSNNNKVKHVDYVAVYRWGEFKKAEGHDEFKSTLEDFYEIIQVSPEGNAALFKRKNGIYY